MFVRDLNILGNSKKDFSLRAFFLLLLLLLYRQDQRNFLLSLKKKKEREKERDNQYLKITNPLSLLQIKSKS